MTTLDARQYNNSISPIVPIRTRPHNAERSITDPKHKTKTNKNCIVAWHVGESFVAGLMTLENRWMEQSHNEQEKSIYRPNKLLLELSRRLSISLLARFKPSPSFLVRLHSWPIFFIRTVATTREMADRNLPRGERTEVRSRAWTPISEIMRRSASLL